jgi:Zn-finger nucleic acid-binding protein
MQVSYEVVMKCPKCKITDLRATRIEEDLPAAGCTTCNGALVSLLYYRDWAERHREPQSAPVTTYAIGDVPDTSTAIMCPKCARLMMKYKISGCVSNRLDVCPGCDEAWLDGCEWELLKALELSHKMPTVFTEQWQRNIRHQIAQDNRRNAIKKTIGDEALAEVERFKEWLNNSSHKADILVYLYAE